MTGAPQVGMDDHRLEGAPASALPGQPLISA